MLAYQYWLQLLSAGGVGWGGGVGRKSWKWIFFSLVKWLLGKRSGEGQEEANREPFCGLEPPAGTEGTDVLCSVSGCHEIKRGSRELVRKRRARARVGCPLELALRWLVQKRAEAGRRDSLPRPGPLRIEQKVILQRRRGYILVVSPVRSCPWFAATILRDRPKRQAVPCYSGTWLWEGELSLGL